MNSDKPSEPKVLSAIFAALGIFLLVSVLAWCVWYFTAQAIHIDPTVVTITVTTTTTTPVAVCPDGMGCPPMPSLDY